MVDVLHTDKLIAQVFQSMIEPAVIINNEGSIISVNQSWLTSPIHSGEQLHVYEGHSYWDLVEGKDNLMMGIKDVLSERRTTFNQEILHNDLDGGEIYSIRVTRLAEDGHEDEYALILYFNITVQKRNELLLKRNTEHYRLIAEHSQDMIKITDIQGRIEYASPSLEVILGHIDVESQIFEYIHPDDINKTKEIYVEMLETKDTYVLELRKRHQDGTWVWLESAFSPVLIDGESIDKIIVVSRDNSERKGYEQDLESMAYHDYLTGLFNRRKIKILAEEVLQEAANSGERFAYLLLDLDKFKTINDTYGHDVGDIVLKEFSIRQLRNKRDGDVVGRLSGDEFAVLMRNVNGREDVNSFIQEFQDSLIEPCVIAELELEIQLKTSIGYALSSDQEESIKQLFKHADNALYKMKRKQKKVITLRPRVRISQGSENKIDHQG